MDQPEHVDATFYVVCTPTWKSSYFKDEKGRLVLEGAKFAKVTQAKPTTMPRGGGVVTKLTLRLPASAFLPLEPEAVIHVRPDDLETVVEVESDNPGEFEGGRLKP